MGSSINIFGLVVKGTNITMNRLNEIRSYLAMNEEIEFSYKGLECFITPNNIVWEFWINDECVIKEPDLDTFLMIPCLEGHTISDIFDNELYDEKSMYIF
ncbi:hypothetical protein [Veillonella atypica]|uniref:hypothetical protein n=1 Tax=Veillonella atypica TaxID=39777 RepID=UPI002E76AD6B|nr:hypothetical protein [Veillonella atypica]